MSHVIHFLHLSQEFVFSLYQIIGQLYIESMRLKYNKFMLNQQFIKVHEIISS